MKKSIMISVNEFVLAEAKEKGFVISHICEEALRSKVNGKVTDEPSERVCAICGKEGEIWDGFLERWICNKCNKNEIRTVSIMAGR